MSRSVSKPINRVGEASLTLDRGNIDWFAPPKPHNARVSKLLANLPGAPLPLPINPLEYNQKFLFF
jgi:hypothetical protein